MDFNLNYLKSIEKYSPQIYQWVVKNNYAMFDFDDCIWSPNRYQNLWIFLTEVKTKYDKLFLVQPHSYFDFSPVYAEAKAQVKEIANELNLSIYFLPITFNSWVKPNDNECFFPHWYFKLRNYAVSKQYQQFKFPTFRKYNFSCNNMQIHREEKIYNFIELWRKNRKDWIISFYNTPYHRFGVETTLVKEGLSEFQNLKPEHHTLWKQKIQYSIREYQYDMYNNENFDAMSVLFSGHVDSYCNLVMEHSMERPIISEKSFKPFVAKQIPIYLGYPRICEVLANLGFDLFYDFIDHKLYDFIGIEIKTRDPVTWPSRIDQVHALINSLYNKKFDEFFHDSSVQKRLAQNQELFFSDQLDRKCIAKLEELITT